MPTHEVTVVCVCVCVCVCVVFPPSLMLSRLSGTTFIFSSLLIREKKCTIPRKNINSVLEEKKKKKIMMMKEEEEESSPFLHLGT